MSEKERKMKPMTIVAARNQESIRERAAVRYRHAFQVLKALEMREAAGEDVSVRMDEMKKALRENKWAGK